MNQSEAEDELTKNMDDDAGLGFAFDVGEVADLAGVEARVDRLHVADADGGVSAGIVGGGHGEATLVALGDHVLPWLVVVDLEAAPVAHHMDTIFLIFPVVLSSCCFI